MCPYGDSVLLAGYDIMDCVHEMRITDCAWVRTIGSRVLRCPDHVDCDADVIVVSEWQHRISVLAWMDGSLRAQFGGIGSGPGMLHYPRGVKLLADGAMAVADSWNHRISVFTRNGEFVATAGGSRDGLRYPVDILERACRSHYVVANFGKRNVMMLNRDGPHVVVYGNGVHGGKTPGALAALPNDRCLVLETGSNCVLVLAELWPRLTWMHACCARTYERDRVRKQHAN
jgi:hypothetical protein